MTLTKCALAGLLAAALAAAPAAAQTAEDLKKATDKLEQATKELQAARDALKVDSLRESAKTIESKIDLLDKDIQELKRDLREIRRRVGDGASTSLRPEYDATTYRGQGRVRFINQFPDEMSVLVNGRSIRLLPGEERLIAVPPGDFTYQVLQLQRSPQDRRILADETKTIRIYPIP